MKLKKSEVAGPTGPVKLQKVCYSQLSYLYLCVGFLSVKKGIVCKLKILLVWTVNLFRKSHSVCLNYFANV